MTDTKLPSHNQDGQTTGAQALFGGLIDYAGLFPPSELPLDEAIRNYAAYREQQDHWILGRFIIPAGKLAELEQYGEELFANNPPFHFSVITPGSDTFSTFLEGFRGNLLKILDFEQQHGDLVSVEVLETRLPLNQQRPENPESLRPFFESLERAVLDELGRPLDLFVEPPWQVYLPEHPAAPSGDFGSTPDDAFDHVATGIQWYNEQRQADKLRMGLKLRCGGTDPVDVPPPDVVASAISHVNRTGIPFKATAGLHHPVRHYNEEFGGWMHGFINVFGAGILGKVHKLDQDELQQIVSETDSGAFRVDENGFAWRDLEISTQRIEQLRQDAFISYGSCSFDEPREDLVEIGIIK